MGRTVGEPATPPVRPLARRAGSHPAAIKAVAGRMRSSYEPTTNYQTTAMGQIVPLPCGHLGREEG